MAKETEKSLEAYEPVREFVARHKGKRLLLD